MDVSDFQFLSICCFFANCVSWLDFPLSHVLRGFKTILELGVWQMVLVRMSFLPKLMGHHSHKLLITKIFKLFINLFLRGHCAAGDLFAWLKQVWKQLILAKNSSYCPGGADSSVHTKHESEFELLWWQHICTVSYVSLIFWEVGGMHISFPTAIPKTTDPGPIFHQITEC